MLKNVSSIFDYLSWLLTKQKELQRHSTIRIVDIHHNEFGESVLSLQIANKATIFQCTASEIVMSDNLLEQFSKIDIRTITYLATRSLATPKQKMVSHRFESEIKKIICNIKNIKTKKLEEKSLADIISSKSINDFNSEDAHRIGFLQAMEQSIQEYEYFGK